MKKMIMVAVVVLITGLLAIPSMAKDHGNNRGPSDSPGNSAVAHEHSNNATADVDAVGKKGPSSPAGQSNIGHLYLYEKTDDGSDDWPIVEGGMWGKMKYNLSGPTFDFVFNGHGLPIGEEYTLIYYPDPWPAHGLICLGSGVVVEDEDGIGNIHIAGSVDTGDLPNEDDTNDGAKIFLVPSSDVDCDGQQMTGWSADANLYEGALITFDDTDDNNASADTSGEETSSAQALYFYEKTSVADSDVKDGSVGWPVVEGGMWGKMEYHLSGMTLPDMTFDFVFNGYLLPAGEYTLILHPNNGDGAGLVCLGSGSVEDEGGSVRIVDSINISDLMGYLSTVIDNYNDGAEIVLVPSGDVDCENHQMNSDSWADDANLYQGAPPAFEETGGDE